MSLAIEKGVKWNQEAFWNPSEVADFLSGLSPHQSQQAKVLQNEVKILVIYPNAG